MRIGHPACWLAVWLATGIAISISSVGWSAEPAIVAKSVETEKGYRVEQVAGPPLVRFPMFACFDDAGRLYVAESSGGDLYHELKQQTRRCSIRVLEDRDGDGHFDHAEVFADRLVYPMGLAWRDGSLYVADPPKIVRLTDTTGDGRADGREPILGDFGHRDNGSLHGLVFGPDGWLYMTMGTPDGFHLRDGGEIVASGAAGALIRCRPDGSRPQVLCRGFENLIEVDFTPTGQILGTNNWYQTPSNGMRDSLVHLVPGGIYPRHSTAGIPSFVATGDPLPAIDLFPAVSLSGLTRLRWNDQPNSTRLVSAQFNTRKVVQHELQRQGSTFSVSHSDLVWSESPAFRPADVLEDADGSILVLDTGLWYVQHCATSSKELTAGGIYRVRRTDAEAVQDARDQTLAWKTLSASALVDLLSDERPTVASRAQGELVARGEAAIPSLTAKLAKVESPIAASHILWSLSQIDGASARQSLREALQDTREDIVATAARALATLADTESGPMLASRLPQQESVSVRLALAEALATCGSRSELPAIWEALGTGDVDRMLEHSLICAAARFATQADLREALGHASPRVQKAALLLLDQPPQTALTQQDILARLSSPDADLRGVAQAILVQHPEWEDAAAKMLEGWLTQPSQASDDEIGAALLALQHLPRVQHMIGQGLAGGLPGQRSQVQRLLLQTIRGTQLDPVPQAWREATGQILDAGPPELTADAVRTAVVLRMSEAQPHLQRIAEDADIAMAVRLDALAGLVALDVPSNASAEKIILAALESESPTDRLAATELLTRMTISPAFAQAILDRVGDDMLIWPTLLPVFARGNDPDTGQRLVERLRRLISAGSWSLTDRTLHDALANYPAEVKQQAADLFTLLAEQQKRQRERIRAYESLLVDGDPVRGRQVFQGKTAACSACHQVQGQGGVVGPDLSHIASVRSMPDMLESMVLPSATFAQGYQTFIVATTDGRVARGTIARERSNQEAAWDRSAGVLLLRDAAGKEQRFSADDIEEIVPSPISNMPEGLLEKLSAEETRDLLAYLQSLK